MLPLLLKPRWCAFKHSLAARALSPSLIARDALLMGFLFLISYLTYRGTESVLVAMQGKHAEFFLSPHIPLQVLLVLVFFLLLFSSGIISLNTLLISDDLERLLAAPISRSRFFIGKFSEILLFSSWSVLVFIIPIVLAFSQFYDAPLTFHLQAIILGCLFVAIPINLSMIAVILFTRVVPASRVKDILLLAGLFTIAGLYLWFRSNEGPQVGGEGSLEDILRIYAISDLDQYSWLPSSWLASALGIQLGFLKEPLLPYLLLLLSAFGASLALAYLSFPLFYQGARTKALQTSYRIRSRQLSLFSLVLPLRWIIPSSWWSIWIKELKLFGRDITQAAQLILLLTLCLIYLLNFRSLPLVTTPPASYWWLSFLSIGNFIMSSFVLIAVSARFAYPTISLEGKAWWQLQCSPLSIRQILWAKFSFWYFSIGSIASVIYLAGGFALQLSEHLLVGQLLLAWISSYGLVGLAIGFGARFATFHWEHPSQITSSLGNFLYMAIAIATILFQLIPVAILCLVDVYFVNPDYGPNIYRVLVFVADLFLFVGVNLVATKRSIEMGASHLAKREQF